MLPDLFYYPVRTLPRSERTIGALLGPAASRPEKPCRTGMIETLKYHKTSDTHYSGMADTVYCYVAITAYKQRPRSQNRAASIAVEDLTQLPSLLTAGACPTEYTIFFYNLMCPSSLLFYVYRKKKCLRAESVVVSSWGNWAKVYVCLTDRPV